MMLDELRTAEIIGHAVPQCSGQFYRKRQCLVGTETCWCVDVNGRKLSREEFGTSSECETVRRRQENLAMKAVALLQPGFLSQQDCTSLHTGSCPTGISSENALIEKFCDCDADCYEAEKCCKSITGFRICVLSISKTSSVSLTTNTTKPTTSFPSTLSLVCSTNEQYTACYSACQPSCQDPTTPACPPPVCTPGCHCLPGFIRRDTSPRSSCLPRSMCQAYDTTMKCADDRRAYQTCGSSCPISCETRNSPRCAEKCVIGCFCKVPYILENGNDPLHSRCVLPSECLPQDEIRPGPFNPFVARQPQLSPSLVIPSGYPTPPSFPKSQPPTLLPTVKDHCSDPLKNYLSCGTKCPASCDSPVTTVSLECSLSCVAGCFCRLPYVLLNSTDSNSPCLLPQLCPRTTTPRPRSPEGCSDPRKTWTTCSASKCARSCTNPEGRCPDGTCLSGCVCREPYVLLDPVNPDSRCVLPTECEQKCGEDKEFQTCGSSCPMGCNNLHPKNCAPCQAGCFCKNGMVFKDAVSWRTSECVQVENCSEAKTVSSSTTTPTTTALGLEILSANQNEQLLKLLKQNRDQKTSTSEQCPETTFDVGSKSCSSDMDCPVEQRCCRPLLVSLGVNPQRCVCPDPNAVWSSCGSLCPEYCSQSAVPVCSKTCSAGCHCAPGFVRSRNDVKAPCVPREQCTSTSFNLDEPSGTVRQATIKEVTIGPRLKDDVAAAVIVSKESVVLGKFVFSQNSENSMSIQGEVFGLPAGEHAVVIHQFGDASDGCSRIGAPFNRITGRTPSLGDVKQNGRFEKDVDLTVSDVIGRAIAIYRFSTLDWINSVQGENAIACGTVGLTKPI